MLSLVRRVLQGQQHQLKHDLDLEGENDLESLNAKSDDSCILIAVVGTSDSFEQKIENKNDDTPASPKEDVIRFKFNSIEILNDIFDYNFDAKCPLSQKRFDQLCFDYYQRFLSRKYSLPAFHLENDNNFTKEIIKVQFVVINYSNMIT